MGRLNTIRIDYGALPNKPGLPKVQKFCAEELGLKRGEVIRIQTSRILNVTFVTVVDLALANKVCEKHGNKHAMTGSDKKKYPVTITMEDGTVLVKLHDLSTDVSNEDVAKFLAQYGDVHDVYEEQLGDDQEFAGAYTGIRIAKMVVKNNIASWVTVNGEFSHCSYFGQRQTCRHCHDFIHIGVGCVQNKKLFVQKTYADAAKQPAKPQQAKPKSNPPTPQLPKEDGKKKPAGGLPKEPKDPNPTETRTANPDKPSTSKNADENQSMPPPPTPSGPGKQQSPTDEKNENKTDGDGNETDSSTSSRRSQRNKSKRQKYNEQDGEDEEL